MVTMAKQISRDKLGRKVLYFDVPEKTGIVSVIGADTVLGAQMVKHLCEAGKTVYGFSQEKDFKFSLKPISEHEAPGLDYPPHPILSDWLVVCIDPQMGFEKYTSRIRSLCNYLFRKKTPRRSPVLLLHRNPHNHTASHAIWKCHQRFKSPILGRDSCGVGSRIHSLSSQRIIPLPRHRRTNPERHALSPRQRSLPAYPSPIQGKTSCSTGSRA